VKVASTDHVMRAKLAMFKGATDVRDWSAPSQRDKPRSITSAKHTLSKELPQLNLFVDTHNT
jgi:hypothetical protein